MTTAITPAIAAVPRMAVRIFVNNRPIVAHENTVRPVHATSAMSATLGRPLIDWNRKASAMTSRIAARPALKRKNFTPASRETKTSVKAMPTPRCARKRKRTVDRDMRGSWVEQVRWVSLVKWVRWVGWVELGQVSRVGRVGLVGRVGQV